MSNIVIKAENLGKKYTIGHQTQRGGYVALRDVISQGAAGLWRKTRDFVQSKPVIIGDELEEVWALKDVNFEIRHGEVVGIIGRNGAGKSTLLKVLSRITEPSAGRVTIRGRVASLLEVGTGFHPELSGRENIFLNGAILGMTRAEIKRKFDEIVAFAEVEKYLDTPVKRYSSGMYVRLAFAVAAHLEPEILVVDEVLAVGDVSFQRKCLGKMGQVASAGRTVLFVSHNMASINQLCPACIWLNQGVIRQVGETELVIGEYVAMVDVPDAKVETVYDEDMSFRAQVRKVCICNAEGTVKQVFECDEPILFDFVWQVHQKISDSYGYLWIKKPDYTQVLVSDSFDAPPNPFADLDPGIYNVRLTIPPRTLAPGDYLASISFKDSQGVSPSVQAPGLIGRFTLLDHGTRRGNKRTGFFSTIIPWKVAKMDAEKSHGLHQSEQDTP